MNIWQKLRPGLLLVWGLCALLEGASYVDAQGQLRVDGEPYFILGVFSDPYYVSWRERLQTISALESGGLNTVRTSASTPLEQIDTHFEYAEKAGIQLIFSGALFNEWQWFHLSVMETYKDEPALLGWYIADDSHGYALDTLALLYEQAKSIDSTHITTHSMAMSPWHDWSLTFIRDRISFCDVLQMQSYPIGKEPIDEVYHDMRHTLLAAEPSRTPVVIDLQLFNWQVTGHDWGRWPTPSEVDLMTWLAVTAGVDGILYYSLHDQLADPEQLLVTSRPELWERLGQIATMMDTLKPFLLNHTFFHTDNPLPNLYYGLWETSSGSLVTAINTSEADSMQIIIPIHNHQHCFAQPLFAERPNTLDFEEGFMKGTLPPQSAQFYRLTDAATGTRSRAVAVDFALRTYPNPGNHHLNITWTAPAAGHLKIGIYSLRGRYMAGTHRKVSRAGRYRLSLAADSFPAGVYFLRATWGNRQIIRKWTYLP